jgi:hypothetical protein
MDRRHDGECVARIPPVQRRNARPSLRGGLDEADLLQACQRIPQRRPAEAQPGAELGVAQLLTRSQDARDDRIAQREVRLVAHEPAIDRRALGGNWHLKYQYHRDGAATRARLAQWSPLPAFCRHNRFAHRCPICSREEEDQRRAARPAGSTAAGRRPAPATRKPGGSAPRTSSVVTRKLARAEDDGYRNDLVPGIKATADAERLAAALAVAAGRLEFPGPHPEISDLAESDVEQAIWLAFLLALAGPDRPEMQAAIAAVRPAWGEDVPAGDLGAGAARTVAAYRQWAERAGSQEAAVTGDPSWTPERRFARAYERLALPGFGRTERFEMLTSLGAALIADLEADALHVDASDRTTTAAKRALLAGEWMLLERRAAALAREAGVPLAALDRGLALWDSQLAIEPPEGEALERIRGALGV